MRRLLSICSALLFGMSVAHAADAAADAASAIRAETSPPSTPFVFDGDLGQLTTGATWQPGDPTKLIPRRRYPTGHEPEQQPRGFGLDAGAARQQAFDRERRFSRGGTDDPQFVNPVANFIGSPNTGAAPPDPTGDVGPNHIIQAVNASLVRIWDKSLPNPNLLAQFSLDSLGSANCGTSGGDPIVLYDRLADRWMLSEFADAGSTLCIYISQTPDPVSGGWFNYNFDVPAFPDYPKYGIWPTDVNGGAGSYVVGANDGGPSIFALDRGNMLQGNAATFQRFVVGGLSGFGFQALQPADLDGPMPPPNASPALVMRHRDTEAHGGSAAGDLLEIFEVQVDWDTPANSTALLAPTIDVSEFDSDLCGLFTFSCILQPGGGTPLDPLREAIMNRLQYFRHDDGIETLVGNLVTDVTGNDEAGVRWFELRRSGGSGGWSLHQEGTYAPDTDSRWMAASAMDQSKNIAVAYNVSSAVTAPELRYTGRKAGDSLGLMTQTETTLVAGSGVQGFDRFGDYSQMGLDPSDDCTFWFSGEALDASGNWFIQFSAFRFESCGCLAAPSDVAPAVEDLGFNRVEVRWDDSDLATVSSYRVERARNVDGPFSLIAEVADTSPATPNQGSYSFVDTTVSGDIQYFYNVVASDGAACTSRPSPAAVTATGRCLLEPLFNGLASAGSTLDATCGVALDWGSAQPECGGPTFYNVYRSTDPGFVPAPSNLIASGITATDLVDVDGLAPNEVVYYVVRALDAANLVEEKNAVELAAAPNTEVRTLLDEGFESAAAFSAWSVATGPGPHNCGEFQRTDSSRELPSGGSGFYAGATSDCGLLPLTSTTLDSPVVDLSGPEFQTATLSFELSYAHRNGDDATVEVFDGSQWVVIWADDNSDVDTRLSFDVTAEAVGNAQFQVRFSYQNANFNLWYSVDDVRLEADVALPCTTAQSPPPVPNGLSGTDGLSVDRSGAGLALAWDATSCAAAQTNLLFGSLAGVSSTQLNGEVCALGSDGSFDWSSVPAGDLFFLLVTADGNGTEGSWGSGAFGERNGLNASGRCGTTLKAVSTTCP